MKLKKKRRKSFRTILVRTLYIGLYFRTYCTMGKKTFFKLLLENDLVPSMTRNAQIIENNSKLCFCLTENTM